MMASGEITVTVQTLDRWRAMAYAPLDGTKVLLLVRHRTWWTAQKCSPEDAGIWEAECEGQWLDHNGGGWSWAGMSGTPIGWRPLNLCERVMPDGKPCGLPPGCPDCGRCIVDVGLGA